MVMNAAFVCRRIADGLSIPIERKARVFSPVHCQCCKAWYLPSVLGLLLPPLVIGGISEYTAQLLSIIVICILYFESMQ